jgi:hypothetical protein
MRLLLALCVPVLLVSGCGTGRQSDEAPDAIDTDACSASGDADDDRDNVDANSTSDVAWNPQPNPFGPPTRCELVDGLFVCPGEEYNVCFPNAAGEFYCQEAGCPCMNESSSASSPLPWTASMCYSAEGEWFYCVWRHKTLCLPCRTDEDCGPFSGWWNKVCVDYGDEGRFCGTNCDGVECPPGYTCGPAEGTKISLPRVCLRSDGICPCPVVGLPPPVTPSSTDCHPDGLPDCTVERRCDHGVLTPCDATECADD